MFAFDTLQIYGHYLDPNLAAFFNLALVTIAANFHLDTGKSTTGSN